MPKKSKEEELEDNRSRDVQDLERRQKLEHLPDLVDEVKDRQQNLREKLNSLRASVLELARIVGDLLDDVEGSGVSVGNLHSRLSSLENDLR